MVKKVFGGFRAQTDQSIQNMASVVEIRLFQAVNESRDVGWKEDKMF